MGTTPTTSPAQPLHHIRVKNISITVFADGHATLQRAYKFQGELRYAKSLREEDIEDARNALAQLAQYFAERRAESLTAASDKQ